jgi:hypothetical protein
MEVGRKSFQAAYQGVRLRLAGRDGGGGIETAQQMVEAPPRGGRKPRSLPDTQQRFEASTENGTVTLGGQPPKQTNWDPIVRAGTATNKLHTSSAEEDLIDRRSIDSPRAIPLRSESDANLPTPEEPVLGIDRAIGQGGNSDPRGRPPHDRFLEGTPAVEHGTRADSLGSSRLPSDGAANAAERLGRVLASGRSSTADSPTRTASGEPQARLAWNERRTIADSGDHSRASRSAAKDGRYETESASTAEPSEFDRLVRALRLRTTSRNSSAQLALDPPTLGRMWVDLRMRNDTMQVTVQAETEAARTLLQERSAQLRGLLERHGLVIDRFDVTVVSGQNWMQRGFPGPAPATPVRSRPFDDPSAAETRNAGRHPATANTLGGMRRRLDIRV